MVWQPYRSNSLKPNQQYYISGEYGLRRGRFSILNPSIELSSNFPVNTARIIPIYREVNGLKSHTIRKLVREALLETNKMPEILPKFIMKNRKLLP